MSKAVVCIIVATALIVVLLVVISLDSNPNHYRHHRHGLSPTLTGSFGPRSRFQSEVVFDPFVKEGQVQRKRKRKDTIEEKKKKKMEKEKQSNKKNSRKSDDENFKFYSDDGRLNVSLRLMVLFPLLDVSPQDGMIDSKELDAWLMHQTVDMLNDRSRREFELRDKDGDGSVSFFEYLPQFTPEDVEKKDTGHGKAGWWMEQFKNADVDGNGALNLFEFRDFTHPEDSRNEHIQEWLLKEKISLMDKSNDSKLDFIEFENGIYDTYKAYVEYESPGEQAPAPEIVFSMLDLDKDRFLRIEELKPTIPYLCPGELTYSKYYSIYLMNQADDNKDGKLTLDEMLKHKNIFYNSVYENSRYYDNYRDEL